MFLTTPAVKDPAQLYRDSLDTIAVAESLGYTTAWLAEAHFSASFGVPAALALLAAATGVSERIRLGTAVIPLAFDSPLRLAETAAVVDTLSGQRLELGVGKGNPRGFSTAAFNAFRLDEVDRNDLFAQALAGVKQALGGPIQAADQEVTLYPPAQDLLGRIWQATGDHVTGAAVGAAGDGLLLFRTVPDGVAGDVQSLLIDTYLNAFQDLHGTGPRIGVSRSVVIASSKAEAITLAAADIEARDDAHLAKPEGTDAASVERFLIDADVAYGSPGDVVQALRDDAAVARSTDYLFNLPFAAVGSPLYREGLEVIAAEIQPRLGTL